MGFLDDLDSAFDTLLSDTSKEEKPKAAEASAPMLDPLAHAIADEQSTLIFALTGQLTQVPRKVLLPALVACLDRFLAVESNTARSQAVQEVALMLKTQQGTIRQRLTSNQKLQLTALQNHLLPASPADTKGTAALLRALASTPDLDTEQVTQLYAAGIWQADQFLGNHLSQLADVSGWSIDDLRQLKNILAPTESAK